MKRKKTPEEKRYTRKLVSSFISMFICLVLLFCTALAWFTANTRTRAGAMNHQVIDTYALKISASAGGADLEQLPTPDDKLDVILQNDITELYPGCYGEFDLYLSIQDNKRPGGTVTIKPTIIPGGYDAEGNQLDAYRTGYNAESATSPTNFLQGHVLLFLNRTPDGIYSDWINPYGGTALSFTNNTQIKIYWVWADYFYKFYTADALFDADALADINQYYLTNNDPLSPTPLAYSNLLDQRGADLTSRATLTRLSHYYDFADEIIGRMIHHFNFRLSFTGLS